MQQNSTNKDQVDLEIGAILPGKITRVTPEGVIVSLPGNNTGLLPIDPPPAATEDAGRFHVDAILNVKIVSKDPDQLFRLTQASSLALDPDDAFDKEFHRLKNMLVNGPAKTNLMARNRSEKPVEESLKDWIHRVETSLPLFHKNRSNRLRVASNDRKKDGGR